MTEARYCTKCGATLDAATLFCTSCGTSISASTASGVGEASSELPKAIKTSHHKTIVISLLIGVLVIILGSIIGYFMWQDYEEYEAGKNIFGTDDRVYVPAVAPAAVAPAPSGSKTDLNNDNWQMVLDAITWQSADDSAPYDATVKRYRDTFERLYGGSEVTLTGVVVSGSGEQGLPPLSRPGPPPYCLNIDKEYISKPFGFGAEDSVAFTVGDIEFSRDLESAYIRLTGIATGIEIWDNAMSCEFKDRYLIPVVKPTSIEFIKRSDVLPAVITSKVDSVISQWGIEINLKELHVTEEEIRIYLNVANEWDVAFDTSGFSHRNMRIEHGGGALTGIGVNDSKGIEGLMDDIQPLSTYHSCDDDSCLEFSAGTNKQIMYLFRGPLASKMVGGEVETFKVIYESEEGSLPYERGVRDFVWEISIDGSGELSATILTEDMSDLPVLKMDIVEIKDAFTANQFTFETNYKGRIFEIVGVIDDIRRTYDNAPVIVLGLAEIEKAALSSTGAYGYTLDCHFNNAKQVVELSKGQEVTVTGLYTDGDLKLMGCNIVTDPGD